MGKSRRNGDDFFEKGKRKKSKKKDSKMSKRRKDRKTKIKEKWEIHDPNNDWRTP